MEVNSTESTAREEGRPFRNEHEEKSGGTRKSRAVPVPKAWVTPDFDKRVPGTVPLDHRIVEGNRGVVGNVRRPCNCKGPGRYGIYLLKGRSCSSKE